jgi:hypothetical protein
MNHMPFPGAGQTMTASWEGTIDCFISTPGRQVLKSNGRVAGSTFFSAVASCKSLREKGYQLERTFWCAVRTEGDATECRGYSN